MITKLTPTPYGLSCGASRRRSLPALFRVLLRWPDAIPDEDVVLPARLADWGELNGIPHVCVEAALRYRRSHAGTWTFVDMQALAVVAWAQYEHVTAAATERFSRN